MRTSNKVLIICSGLYTPGDIERATVNLANLLCLNNIDVTLLILDKTLKSFYEIEPRVKILHGDLHFGITQSGNVFTRKVQFLNHIRKLRRIFKSEKPHKIISTEHAFSIAAYLTQFKKAELFSWEHHHFFWIKKNRFWQILFKSIYPKIECIVCLNKTEAGLFKQLGCNTVVIPNFVFPQEKVSDLKEKNLLTVGWLIRRKGVDLIPEIAEQIKKRHPDWHWQLIGDGVLASSLQKEIDKREIKDFLQIVPPTSSDLSSVYQQTSIYVMTSRFECFPMVLLESMSFCIPCIAFDCPTGPADIIHNKEDGILIEPENVRSMVQAISSLIENTELRKKMGEKAANNVQRFSPETILNLWLNLIHKT